MDNLNSDMSARPDPPGSSDFIFRYIDDNFDGAGTASTITDIMLSCPQFSHIAHQHQQAKHQQW